MGKDGCNTEEAVDKKEKTSPLKNFIPFPGFPYRQEYQDETNQDSVTSNVKNTETNASNDTSKRENLSLTRSYHSISYVFLR